MAKVALQDKIKKVGASLEARLKAAADPKADSAVKVAKKRLKRLQRKAKTTQALRTKKEASKKKKPKKKEEAAK